MNLSIVVRSLNEADRLRLMLASLTRQSISCEVVVVDDGSIDHTPAVIAEFGDRLHLRGIRHEEPRGRSGASNAGAAAATGDIVLFMDGDTLLAPNAAERHLETHRRASDVMVRGLTHHLRCTRFLLDPATASPQPGQEERLARLSDAERDALKVTVTQVRDSFDQIIERAAPGIYPGIGPSRLYELEREALQKHPDCSMLWAAASGSNFSVSREVFLGVGGFDERIDQNEHRELALRLSLSGLKLVLAADADTYHLTHRSRWRDPMQITDWEVIFYNRHPILAVKLLSVFWAGIASPSPVPAAARIENFLDLEHAASGRTGIDYDEVRRAIPGLPDLSVARA